MKSTNLIAACLSVVLFSSHAMAEGPSGIEPGDYDKRNIELWRLPAVPQPLDTFQLIDTQPDTRAIAKDRVVYRLGYSINEISRAHRLHIEYLPDSDNLTHQEVQSIRNLVQSSNEQDRVVVTGYSGVEDKDDGNLDLAKRRAEKIRDVIVKANPKVVVKTDATTFWGGNPGDARRADIFLIPGLDN